MPSFRSGPKGSDLFRHIQTPTGFRYITDVFTAAEEIVLVQKFQGLPFKPFEFQGYLGNRRIVSYGYRYDYAARALRDADRIPAFLDALKETASRATGIRPAALSAATRRRLLAYTPFQRNG